MMFICISMISIAMIAISASVTAKWRTSCSTGSTTIWFRGAALTVSTDRIGQKARKSKTTFASTVRSCATAAYHFVGTAGDEELSVTPLVGLGKSSLLNKTIFPPDALCRTQLTICTLLQPPAVLVRNIIQLLRDGKQVEIIVGDKTRTISTFLKISRLKSSAPFPICMRSTCGVSSAGCSIMSIPIS